VSGGTSFFYFFDYLSGLPSSGTTAGYPFDQMIVGNTITQTADGLLHNNTTCVSGDCTGVGFPPPSNPKSVKRFSYRAF
jgi:hypothetical protein